MESLSPTHGKQGNLSIAYNINKEGSDRTWKGATMTFVRDVIVGKKSFGDALSLPDGYGK